MSSLFDLPEIKALKADILRHEKAINKRNSQIWELEQKEVKRLIEVHTPQNAVKVVWRTLKGDGQACVESVEDSREQAMNELFDWIYQGAYVHYGYAISVDSKGVWHAIMGDYSHKTVCIEAKDE